MCRKMSEENYYVRKNMWKQAGKLFWQDIKRMKIAIILICLYLAFMKFVLHSGCPFVVLTGFPCAACGLTRAGVPFLKGEWIQAWNIHPAIFPIVILFIAFIVQRYFRQASLKGLKKYVIILILGMVILYVYRFFTQFPNNPPMSYYPDNLMLRIVKWMKI